MSYELKWPPDIETNITDRDGISTIILVSVRYFKPMMIKHSNYLTEKDLKSRETIEQNVVSQLV